MREAADQANEFRQRSIDAVHRYLDIADGTESLVTKIAEWLALSIIEGALTFGAFVNTVELSSRFGTSRTPVREALMLMERHGLVAIPPRRRPYVASISMRDVEEIYAVRALLSQTLMEHVAANASDEDIDSLRPLFREMKRYALQGMVDGYFWSSVAFHDRGADICGNKFLRHMLNLLGLRSLQLRHVSLSQPTRIQQSCADHERLLLAYDERDVQLAGALGRSITEAGLRAIKQSGWLR